jgi:hypothetical protein
MIFCISNSIDVISLLIGFLTLLVASATFYYFLRERKRGLSEVVYQKQVDACYDIMLIFSNLESSLVMWGNQRNARGVYSVDYRLEAIDEYNNLQFIFRKYNLILSNDLISGIQKLTELFQEQIETMDSIPKSDPNLEILSYGFYELQGKMREQFGIEKLSKSNESILEHFDKAK